MKTCSRCGFEYKSTLNNFHKFKQSKDGLHCWCKRCVNDYDRERYKRRKHKVINNVKRWRENNLEHRLKYEKEYHLKNRDEILKKQKKYRINNREKISRQQREHYQKNKEKRKAYIKRFYQTEHGRFLDNQSYYRRKRMIENSINTIRSEDWSESLDFFNNQCAYCGVGNVNLHQEHVIPISKGGHNTRQNVIPACIHCNSRKSDSFLEDWYTKQEFYSEQKMSKIRFWTGAKNNTQQIALF